MSVPLMSFMRPRMWATTGEFANPFQRPFTDAEITDFKRRKADIDVTHAKLNEWLTRIQYRLDNDPLTAEHAVAHDEELRLYDAATRAFNNELDQLARELGMSMVEAEEAHIDSVDWDTLGNYRHRGLTHLDGR